MQYECLKKHLDSVGQTYEQIVDLIVQQAQYCPPGEDVDIEATRILYDYDFLQDRDLITEMLAERPEVAFVEHHNNGFTVRLREQNMTADEQVFAEQIQRIDGADMGRLAAWLEHARSLADVDAESINASAAACYRKVLSDFGSAFQEMEQKYPGTAAAIFNHREGYLPNELLPAADWIHNDGTAEEAYTMAQAGAFELNTYVPRGPKALIQAKLEAMAEQHNINLNNQLEGQCADFSSMVLLGLDMHGMNFCGASFAGAVLRDCDLTCGSFDDCDFSGAVFHAAQAGSASFEQSVFTGARLEGCNFWNADFECGDFTRAVFEDTNLDHATLDGCDFHGARFEGTDLSAAPSALATGLPDSKAQALVEVAQAGTPSGAMASREARAQISPARA